MRLTVLLTFILISCDQHPGQEVENEYVEIKYIGDHGFHYRRLIISVNKMDKMQVLNNDPYHEFDSTDLDYDTFKIDNYLVGPDLYQVIKEHVLEHYRIGSKEEKSAIDYSEFPIVGYDISLIRNDAIEASDVYVNKERCANYFSDFIRMLDKENADSLVGVINQYYVRGIKRVH